MCVKMLRSTFENNVQNYPNVTNKLIQYVNILNRRLKRGALDVSDIFRELRILVLTYIIFSVQ